LRRGQFAGKDGNENDVVDSQDDFEHRQSKKADPTVHGSDLCSKTQVAPELVPDYCLNAQGVGTTPGDYREDA
jgi:hypothetical protein